MSIEIRECAHDLDLGWNPGGPLNVVILQPCFEIEGDAQSFGLIGTSSRAGQEALAAAVADFIRDRDKCVPDPDYRPVHAVILPEFAVPQSGVAALLEAVAQARSGLLLVAGIERQTIMQYTHLLNTYSTVAEWVEKERTALHSQSGAENSWVNAALIAWKATTGARGVVVQRKITPSDGEIATLCAGSAIHVLRINHARVAFSICSDMLNRDGACPSAEHLISHFVCRDRPPLHAMVHIQYNPDSHHDLMEAGIRRLLVESPTTAGNLFVDTMLIRANVGLPTEDGGRYGRSGIAVGAHRRNPRPPDCCHVHGEPVRHYDLRPCSAAAFLLQAQLPAWTHPPSAAAAVRPVIRGLWLGGLKPGTAIDFTSETAACPEPYRFAAWRAFPAGHPPVPCAENTSAELRAHLEVKYENLRQIAWGSNGACLEAWGREAFALSRAGRSREEWERDPRSQPDTWTAGSALLGCLQRLAKGLALIHAGRGLAIRPSGAGQGIRVQGTSRSVRCRVAPETPWRDVRSRVAVDARDTPATDGDIYVTVGYTGKSPKRPARVRVAGLNSEDSPTYPPRPERERLVTETHVTLVSGDSLEDVLSRKRMAVSGLAAAVARALGM
jgi:hypothetical protein